MLNDLRDEAYKMSIRHGFWEERRKAGIYGEVTALMLAAGEIHEAVECLRRGKDEDVVYEVADCIIRLLDYCGYKNYNIDKAIAEKMAENDKRPYLHNRRF